MPLIVIVLDDHAALTPEGNPVAVPIPVAPDVVWVMFVIGVLILTVGVDEAAPTVFVAVTVNVTAFVPVAVPLEMVMVPEYVPEAKAAGTLMPVIVPPPDEKARLVEA